MLSPDSTPALLIIDMQNGFCHPAGSFAKIGIQTDPEAIIPNINRLRAAFHAAGAPVFYLRTAYSADYSDRRGRDRGDSIERLHGLLRGSWDAEILDELTPAPAPASASAAGGDETVLIKTRNSGFYRTELERILKEQQQHGAVVNHLVLTGVGTDVCVETTARDAYQMDFGVTTVRDATAACSVEDHLAALHALRRFGGTASTDDVIEALQRLGC